MANSVQQQTTSAGASSTTPKTPVAFDDELFLFLPRLGEILKT